MKKICGIYKIINLKTDQFYIGKSTNIKQRWYQHRHESKNNQHYLYQDMRLFGLENFKLEIVEECKKEELSKKEHFYIYTLDPYYNNTDGLDYAIANHKLSKKDVLKIQELLIKGHNKKEIAYFYNVSLSTINNINLGKSWHNSSFIYPLYNTEDKYPKEFFDYLKRIHHNYDINDL